MRPWHEGLGVASLFGVQSWFHLRSSFVVLTESIQVHFEPSTKARANNRIRISQSEARYYKWTVFLGVVAANTVVITGGSFTGGVIWYLRWCREENSVVASFIFRCHCQKGLTIRLKGSKSSCDGAGLPSLGIKIIKPYVKHKWKHTLVKRWSMIEDYKLAEEINRVSREVNNVVIERSKFLEELESLGVRHVPAKLAEFFKEIQTKDRETVEKLQILEKEIELNAYQKDLYIQKLKGAFRIEGVGVVAYM
ncbi:hypothetical protein Tco_0537370 [Tanacetum coccineum]